MNFKFLYGILVLLAGPKVYLADTAKFMLIRKIFRYYRFFRSLFWRNEFHIKSMKNLKTSSYIWTLKHELQHVNVGLRWFLQMFVDFHRFYENNEKRWKSMKTNAKTFRALSTPLREFSLISITSRPFPSIKINPTTAFETPIPGTVETAGIYLAPERTQNSWLPPSPSSKLSSDFPNRPPWKPVPHRPKNPTINEKKTPSNLSSILL